MLVETSHVRVHEQSLHIATPLVHRAFVDPSVQAEHHSVRLVPCVMWWMGNDRIYEVNEMVTCIACLAAKRP